MNRAAAIFFPTLLFILSPVWTEAAEYPQACRHGLALESEAYRQVATFQHSSSADAFRHWGRNFFRARQSYIDCAMVAKDQSAEQLAVIGVVRSTTWLGLWWEKAATFEDTAQDRDKEGGDNFQQAREGALQAYHTVRIFLAYSKTRHWAFTKRSEWKSFSSHYGAWLAGATDRVDTLTDEKTSIAKFAKQNEQVWSILPDSLMYPRT
jgi:hypothetical protein